MLKNPDFKERNKKHLWRNELNNTTVYNLNEYTPSPQNC